MTTRRSGYAFILAIRCYRATLARIPRRSSCLFSPSCSNHVEHELRVAGARAGVRAAKHRLAACRPGYVFEFDEAAWWIRCVDGSEHRPDDLSPAVHAEAEVLLGVLARTTS